jgi:hypothetical protein
MLAAMAATLMTALLDLGRGRLAGPFARSFEHEELPLLERLLRADAPMLLYLDPALAPLVRRHRDPARTRLVPLRLADLRASPRYARIQALRTDPAWLAQAPWLAYSPAGALPDYLPFLHARLGWLAEQARLNPFATQHLFWVDPSLDPPPDPSPPTLASSGSQSPSGHAHPLASSPSGTVRAPEAPEIPTTEITPKPAEPPPPDRLHLTVLPDPGTWHFRGFAPAAGRVVRPDLYGGRPAAIAAAAAAYEAALDEALADGHLGTDADLLTRLLDRRPDLFAPAPPPPARRRDTLVTAVYDLDPSAPLGGRARPVAYYLPSLASIAAMGAGLVVYTRPEHVARLSDHFAALDAPALVLGRDLESAPRCAQIQEMRLRQRFPEMPWRDRCHVLCHAKLAWLAEQAAADPFRSSRFYWIDAGLAYPGLMPRRYLPDYRTTPCALFTPRVLDALADGQFVVVGQRPVEGRRMHDIPLDDHPAWIGQPGRPIEAQIVGGLFGGDPAAVAALRAEYDRVLAAMLGADRLGTEENVLTVLYHRDPARMRLLPFSTWYHEDSDVRRPRPAERPFYRIFEELAGVAPTSYAAAPAHSL